MLTVSLLCAVQRALRSLLAVTQNYDYKTDPEELHNLANQPMQAERIARMKSRLATHLKVVTIPQRHR
jgi:hypothetical protein